jgi:hypothetical protein
VQLCLSGVPAGSKLSALQLRLRRRRPWVVHAAQPAAASTLSCARL